MRTEREMSVEQLPFSQEEVNEGIVADLQAIIDKIKAGAKIQTIVITAEDKGDRIESMIKNPYHQ